MRRTDLTNRQFGKLHVLEFSGRDQQGHALWLCRCDCGRETVVAAWRLNSGKSQSCGCARNAWREAQPKPERPEKPTPKQKTTRSPAPRKPSPCYNVYCEFRNNVPRGSVWNCTNQKICPDCQHVRSSEKGDRHDE